MLNGIAAELKQLYTRTDTNRCAMRVYMYV